MVVEVAFLGGKSYVEEWPDDLDGESPIVELVEHHPDLLSTGMESLTTAVERALGPQGINFLIRALGADVVDQLKAAWRVDRAVFRSAIDKGMADLMPYLSAFKVCQEAVNAPPLPSKPMTAAAEASIDHLVEVFSGQTTGGIDVAPERNSPLPTEGETSTQMSIVRAPSSIVVELLASLESPLILKVRGAREVLGVSSDAVSQAANSAVELIDHTLRAFSDETVLTWIYAYLPDENDLTYVDPSGSERPTKRAQALHMLFAGRAPEDEALAAAMSVVADVLTTARRGLERLKHGRLDRSEEPKIEMLLSQVEAAVTVLLGVIEISPESHREVVHASLTGPNEQIRD